MTLVGLLPYYECLQTLKLTSLVARRSRADLIEVLKASHGLSQLNGVFRSGLNMVCKSGGNRATKIKSIKRNFIDEKVILFWNKLPIEVKNASRLEGFKSGLEILKS